MSFHKQTWEQKIKGVIDKLNRIDQTLSDAYFIDRKGRKVEQLYEFYCYVQLLRAISNNGSTLTCSHQNQFIFAGGPRSLYKHPASYFTLSNSNRQHDIGELHMNLMVRGSSDSEHEADIVLLSPESLINSRQEELSPKFDSKGLLLECKHYSQKNIGITEARNFLGLCSDLAFKNNVYLITTAANLNAKHLINGHNLNMKEINKQKPDCYVYGIFNCIICRYLNFTPTVSL
ncbi:hypothetical protein [Salicibibacter kimchii]|uniref:Restriction endonuclease n=1 Tax=Salicibibacter kimchii TaxID=2099786 RepID=A0A345C298_9BACI|nr:hypothetical protein [Salicibibacter kimchii]AXF57329.1 hypothetical protein DT065_15855 [Salicibibacter kimchii]